MRFVDLADAGDPVEAAKAYDRAGADELCFLDITASHEDRGTILDVVARTAEQCFMPVTVGGGVRTVDDVRALMLAGADKVAINTAAIRNRRIVADAAEKFGAQAIVVAMDAKTVSRAGEAPRWELYTHGGRNPTGIDAVDYAREVAELGAGELLLTSMDRDGTGDGFDLALTKDGRRRRAGSGRGIRWGRHTRPSRRGCYHGPCFGGPRRVDFPFRHIHNTRRQGIYDRLRRAGNALMAKGIDGR